MVLNRNSQNVLSSADGGVTSPVSTAWSHGAYLVSMRMTEELFTMLNELAEASGQELDQVIGKAFLLYKAASDARKDGKAVGVATSSDVLETEFIGI